MSTLRTRKHTLLTLGAIAAASIALSLGVATRDGAAQAAQERQQGRGRNAEAKGRGAPQTSPEAEAAEARLLAERLADLGRRTNNALALASAAQIMLDVGTQELDARRTTERGRGAAAAGRDTARKAARQPTDPASLLAEAERMAAGNQTTIALIRQLQDRARQQPPARTRGARGGPRSHVDSVLAYATDVYYITFEGRRPAFVSVRGDGDTDLDCYVSDQNGNAIVSDVDDTDWCILRWTPRWTGQFRIRIRNLGEVYNVYRIVTN